MFTGGDEQSGERPSLQERPDSGYPLAALPDDRLLQIRTRKSGQRVVLVQRETSAKVRTQLRQPRVHEWVAVGCYLCRLPR